MKIQKFLLATMLCGVFGIFTACSDDDVIENVVPEVTPGMEEVETYLALLSGVNNGNFTTRASVDDVIDSDEKVDEIDKLAVAIFNVENDVPGKLIYFNESKNVKKDNQDGSEATGYYLDPIKFKITPEDDGFSNIAVVVLANYGKLFEDKDFAKINTFNGFKEFTDGKMNNNYGVNYHNFDGEEHVRPEGWPSQYPIRYPMSSNVNFFKIKAGAINSIGYKDPENAKEYINENANIENDNFYVSQYAMIDLYRGAAEIELRTLKFADYGNLEFDHFILEEVFVMNVPAKVNWFNSATLTDSKKTWGDDLNIDVKTYITNGKAGNFLSGHRRAIKPGQQPANGAIEFEAGDFCSNKIWQLTNNDGLYMNFVHINANYRKNAEKSNLKNFDESENSSFYGRFNRTINNEFTMRKNVDNVFDEYEAIKFAVSPSNYSLGEDGNLKTDQAICLVVRGRYFYDAGNGTIVGPNNDKAADSRYWTVVVNKKGESSIYNNSVPDHSNCVKRNVRYEISLTINGPGSKTPWDYDENSYVVPKVRIVPFGVVEQNSTLD